MLGACGSGDHDDCQKYCSGGHGILCADAVYFNISWNECTWNPGYHGVWVNCVPGVSLATGLCGSGGNGDCASNVWTELQCCPVTYNQQK